MERLQCSTMVSSRMRIALCRRMNVHSIASMEDVVTSKIRTGFQFIPLAVLVIRWSVIVCMKISRYVMNVTRR